MSEMDAENSKPLDTTFDLKELFDIFWKNKIKIISSSIILSFLITLGSYFFPNQYTSSAILAPSKGTSDLSQLAGQYSGIANLVGLELGGSDIDDVFQGMEIIKSLDFFEKIISKNDLFFKLFAVNGWNSKDNSLKVNRDFYIPESNKWVYSGNFSFEGKPSLQSSHRKFMKKFSISRDKVTGIIYIFFEHYSPYVAKELLENVIYEINEYKRVIDREAAEKTIEFLEKELEKTKILNVKIGINSLIQRKIEEIALTNVSPEYFLKVISKPRVPELKSMPKRGIILTVSLIISFIASYLVFFFIPLFKKIRG